MALKRDCGIVEILDVTTQLPMPVLLLLPNLWWIQTTRIGRHPTTITARSIPLTTRLLIMIIAHHAVMAKIVRSREHIFGKAKPSASYACTIAKEMRKNVIATSKDAPDAMRWCVESIGKNLTTVWIIGFASSSKFFRMTWEWSWMCFSFRSLLYQLQHLCRFL